MPMSIPSSERWDPQQFAKWDLRPETGARELSYGVRADFNPETRIVRVETHYSADPSKRSRKFYEQQVATQAFKEREYELAWRAAEGKGVYEHSFSEKAHVAEGLRFEPRRALYVGWDFGRDPCAVFAQVKEGGRLEILSECLAPDRMSVLTFLPYYFDHVAQRYPNRTQVVHVADPSGWAKGQTSEAGVIDILHSHEIYPFQGPVAFSDRQGAVDWWLVKMDRDGAKLVVDRDHAPVVVEGFRGGYAYKRQRDGHSPMPIKNRYSHPHDCVQYIAWRAKLSMVGREIMDSQELVTRTRRKDFTGMGASFRRMQGARKHRR